MNTLLHTIWRGIFTVLLFFGIDQHMCYFLLGCITIGRIAGETICTEYDTSKSSISIAQKSRIGSASVIFQGLGISMLPLLSVIAIAVLSF